MPPDAESFRTLRRAMRAMISSRHCRILEVLSRRAPELRVLARARARAPRGSLTNCAYCLCVLRVSIGTTAAGAGASGRSGDNAGRASAGRDYACSARTAAPTFRSRRGLSGGLALWQAGLSFRERGAMIRYRKLGYVELMVTDLERSAAFYRDIVGLEPAGEGPEGERRFRCSEDPYAVVLHKADQPGFRRGGWMLEDERQFEGLHAALKGAGVAFEVAERRGVQGPRPGPRHAHRRAEPGRDPGILPAARRHHADTLCAHPGQDPAAGPCRVGDAALRRGQCLLPRRAEFRQVRQPRRGHQPSTAPFPIPITMASASAAARAIISIT